MTVKTKSGSVSNILATNLSTVGIISLAVLSSAVVVRMLPLQAGISSFLFAIDAMVALYLNVFVLIVQLFLKVPALNALAPTQTEMPFVLAQGVVFVVFGALTIVVALKTRPKQADGP